MRTTKVLALLATLVIGCAGKTEAPTPPIPLDGLEDEELVIIDEGDSALDRNHRWSAPDCRIDGHAAAVAWWAEEFTHASFTGTFEWTASFPTDADARAFVERSTRSGFELVGFHDIDTTRARIADQFNIPGCVPPRRIHRWRKRRRQRRARRERLKNARAYVTLADRSTLTADALRSRQASVDVLAGATGEVSCWVPQSG